MVSVDHDELRGYVAALLAGAGMTPPDAKQMADCLVESNLWGVDSHGVLRVPIYVERLRSGAMNPRPRLDIVAEHGAVAVLEGDGGPGFLAGLAGMRHAVTHAGEHGVGVCAVRDSNHFGAAGLYARAALDEGMIGIAMTNVMPNMVAPGGSRPVVGNNPLAVAVPAPTPFPIVLDISLSAAAGGKLLLASKRGEKIPLDWATDAEGHPTDDPDAAFAGFLLPIAGVKGLGLAYIVDILCGVLAGGAFGWDVKSMYAYPKERSETGHFLVALDIGAFMDRAEFDARMARYCASVKGSPLWDDTAEMLLPGELEHRTEVRRRAEGIPLPRGLYDELLELGHGFAGLPSLHRLRVVSTPSSR